MHFIKGKNSNLYLPSLRLPESKVGCEFQIEKYKSDGTITYKGPKFHNLVLDSGLNALASYTPKQMIAFCNVGTGSGELLPENTGLSAFKAASSTFYSAYNTTYSTTNPSYYKWSGTFSFSIGTVTGNLTEVGLSRLSNSSYLNRQFFKDINGDPVTITVLSDEGIRISVSLYVYFDLQNGEEETGSFLLNSDTINYIRKINYGTDGFFNQYDTIIDNTYIGYLHLVTMAEISSTTTGFPNGNNASSVVQASYVSGSFERSATFKWLAGNFSSTINTICFNPGVDSADLHCVAFYISPGIVKTSTQELTLTFKKKWGRYVAP